MYPISNFLPLTNKWLKSLIYLSVFLLFPAFLSFISLNLSLKWLIASLLTVISLFLIIKFPEIGFALFFTSGLVKGWLQVNVSLFQELDYTALIFCLVLLAIPFHIKNSQRIIIWPPARVNIPLLSFSLLMLFSLSYTPSFNYGFQKTIRFLFFNVVIFYGATIYFQHRETIQRFFYWLISFGVIVAVTNGIDLFYTEEFGRTAFLNSTPIETGNFLSFCSIVLICFVFYSPSKKLKCFYTAIFMYVMSIAISAGSRGPLLCFGLTVIILGVFIWKFMDKRFMALLLAVVFIWVALSFLFLPERATWRFRIGTADHKDTSINTRLDYINYVSENPEKFGVFGVGIGGFSYLYSKSDDRIYPHNIFLETFCELGIIGIILLVWFFVASFWMGLRCYYNKSAGISHQQNFLLLAIICPIVFYFLEAQLSGDLNDIRTIWLLLGILISITKEIPTYLPCDPQKSK